MEYDLSEVDEREFRKSSPFYNRRKYYFTADLTIRMIIGSHVKFELWLGGREISSRNPIVVTWGKFIARKSPMDDASSIFSFDSAIEI